MKQLRNGFGYILIAFGVSGMVGGCIAAVYYDITLMLIGGIVQIVEACKADPVSSTNIALGILRVIMSGLVAIVGCAASVAVGMGVISIGKACVK